MAQRCILVVDDRVDVTQTMTMLLETVGHHTACAHNGAPPPAGPRTPTARAAGFDLHMTIPIDFDKLQEAMAVLS